MPLSQCPHMAARCPHERLDCHDPASRHCHYITVATSSNLSILSTLQQSIDVLLEEPALEREYEHALEFLRRLKVRDEDI